MRWAKQHGIDDGLMGSASAPGRHRCILCNKAVQQVIKSALQQSVIVQWFHLIGAR